MTVDAVAAPLPSLDAYARALGEQRTDRLRAAAGELAGWLDGRAVWNVNSTARGGGVAELLAAMVPLAATLGVPARWLVADGPPEFFAVTKRLCGMLYGVPDPARGPGPADRACYEAAIAAQLPGVLAHAAAGDLVVLHDPQTAGLIPELARAGRVVIWRCHIGTDAPSGPGEAGWEFLRRYLGHAHAVVCTLAGHAPGWLRATAPPHAITPSVDPLSPKNIALSETRAGSVLERAGLFRPGGGPLIALAQDRPVRQDRPLVVQISRWDRLKDMPGVLTAFARHVAPGRDADLLLAGPEVRGVADDPDAADAYGECLAAWRSLPPGPRARVHLGTMPVADTEANALLVNALQRRAAVVTQKSLAEGFGLTVTEAMWKAAPVVASTVGGIAAQLTSGTEGILVGPRDLAAFGAAVAGLLDDRAVAARLGQAARQRAAADHLVDRQLLAWPPVLRAAVQAAGKPAGKTGGQR
jgi:trehalose synthase